MQQSPTMKVFANLVKEFQFFSRMQQGSLQVSRAEAYGSLSPRDGAPCGTCRKMVRTLLMLPGIKHKLRTRKSPSA
jgi:hypothetical protein